MTVRKNKAMAISSRVSSTFAAPTLALSMFAIMSSAYAEPRIDKVSVIQLFKRRQLRRSCV